MYSLVIVQWYNYDVIVYVCFDYLTIIVRHVILGMKLVFHNACAY